MVFGASVLACGTAFAQSAFPPCGTALYQIQGPGGTNPNQLYNINTNANPLVYEQIGTSTLLYNAADFNPADNFIYGILGSASNLVQIDSTGATVDLGAIAGLPAGGNYFSGAFAPGGNILYVRGNANNNIYAVNIATKTATLVTPTPLTIGTSFDLAWSNGSLYTVPSNGNLYRIDPTSGTVTLVGPTGLTPAGAVLLGAMFGAPNGLFGSLNGGGFYQLNLTTGAATLISASPSSGNNDGAHCPAANIAFGADLRITKTDNRVRYPQAAPVTYTIVVSNVGPFGAVNVPVRDVLPAGVDATTVTWTCGTPTGNGTCAAASGAAANGNAINDALVSLPVNASVTFTLTMTVPVGQTGDFVNTVTVTAPSTVADPTPANNTATDTDTPAQADLSLTKTNTPGVNGDLDQATDTLVAGATTTYTVRVTNNGPDTVTGPVVRDTPVSGLTCADTNPVTVTTTGGAIPAGQTLTVGTLRGAGITLGQLTTTQTATLTFQCTVG